MTKNPARRLGCTAGEAQIRSHAFFKDLDWEALELRKVKPPFRPRVVRISSQPSLDPLNSFNIPLFFFFLRAKQKSPKDALNFDTEFTKEEPVLTPVPNDVIRCINQDEFTGFSFVNKNFGPERKVC